MKKEKLKEIVLKYLEYRDEDVILWFLNSMIFECDNQKIIDVYKIIENEMAKGYADKTPQEIWIEQGFGGELFPLDMFDLHAMFYYQAKRYISNNCSDDNFLKIVIPAFILGENYKQSQKSSFHKHSPAYRDFLDKRKHYIERIKTYEFGD